ncbi:alkaline phosphatase family protein [Beutenbergia cavernae]|uniref:alkaline phosphatase family protein n=1 Tax=Beutenbergia cavernae TaxID=84757 RepID=UPI0016517494|nr:alkaline phosphatase family protein [Beutenbergia cavernae]
MAELDKRPKVLVVGWDGVRDDTLRQMAPEAISEIASRGRWWTTTLPDVDIAPTMTAVGWSTILTGVWPDRHEVLGNDDTYHLLHRYPDMLTRAFCARPDIATYAATSALIFGTDFGPGPVLGPGVRTMTWFDRRTYPGGFADTDVLVADDAERRLGTQEHDFSFVYLGETDSAAHAHGVGSRYEEAIARQDARLARMVQAIRARPTFDDESWLVMLTTDHGHRDEGGHGRGSWQERQSFVVAGLLDGSPATWATEAANVDIAPTAWAHLRVTPSERWLCQGTSLLAP